MALEDRVLARADEAIDRSASRSFSVGPALILSSPITPDGLGGGAAARLGQQQRSRIPSSRSASICKDRGQHSD